MCFILDIIHSHAHNSDPAPIVPDGLNITHSLPTKAELSWISVPIEKRSGVITGYKIQVVGPDSPREITVLNADTTTVAVSNLRPFTSYTFNVSAMTKAGTGPAASVSSKTPEAGEIFNFI